MGRDKTGARDSFPSHINPRNKRETYSTLEIIFHKACELCGGYRYLALIRARGAHTVLDVVIFQS
jgi:hypothetical protein